MRCLFQLLNFLMSSSVQTGATQEHIMKSPRKGWERCHCSHTWLGNTQLVNETYFPGTEQWLASVPGHEQPIWMHFRLQSARSLGNWLWDLTHQEHPNECSLSCDVQKKLSRKHCTFLGQSPAHHLVTGERSCWFRWIKVGVCLSYLCIP